MYVWDFGPFRGEREGGRMDKDMTQMMTMMQQMHASMQGLVMSVDALGKRFDGLEMRFDGLEKRFEASENRLNGKIDKLAMEFIRCEDRLTKRIQASVEKNEGLCRHAATAAVSAEVSANKVITHGPMLIDHEDRIRSLEGKRKAPPSAPPKPT